MNREIVHMRRYQGQIDAYRQQTVVRDPWTQRRRR